MAVLFFIGIGILAFANDADPCANTYRYEDKLFKKQRNFQFLVFAAQVIMIGFCLYLINTGQTGGMGALSQGGRAKVAIGRLIFSNWPFLLLAYYGWGAYLNFPLLKARIKNVEDVENELKDLSTNQLAFRQDYIDWLNASNWGVLNYEYAHLTSRIEMLKELKKPDLTEEQRKNTEKFVKRQNVLSNFLLPEDARDLVRRVHMFRGYNSPCRMKLPDDLWDCQVSGEKIVQILIGPFTTEQKEAAMEVYGEPNNITERKKIKDELETGTIEKGYNVLMSSALYLDRPINPKTNDEQ